MRSNTDRTGEKNKATNGMTMEIIDYKTSKNFTVKFLEDGTIVKCKSYQTFKLGTIRNPNVKMNSYGNKRNDGSDRRKYGERKYLHQRKKANNGMTMEIIEYNGKYDITVKFLEDGTIVEHALLQSFHNGGLKNPNLENPTGETTIAKNGLKATIIDCNDKRNLTIQFEDGNIVTKSYELFKKGVLKHPTLNVRRIKTKGTIYHTNITDKAFTHNDITHYYCDCPICKAHEIWSFEQIKNHKCNASHPLYQSTFGQITK